MKKLFILVVMLLLPLSAKANESQYYIAIDNGREIIYEQYTPVLIDWLYNFKVSPFGTYEINDAYYLNNLAEASTYLGTQENLATIQMLIYQNTHPDYNFYLVDENLNYYDNSAAIEYVLDKIAPYEITPDFANQTFYLDINEELALEHPSLSNYILDDFQINDNTVTMRFSDIGEYVINFHDLGINVAENNYFHTCYFLNKPFSIKVIVNNYYDLTIETYINDQLVTNDFSIDEFNYNDSQIRLSAGNYNIVDNYTNKTYNYELLEDSNLIINNYFVNRLETNIAIDKICDELGCYEFTRNNNIYEFSNKMATHNYQIYSDGTIYNVDFANKDNYEINNGKLTYKYFVKLPEDNESYIEEPIITTPLENPNTEIIIAIPDTNITFMDNLTYYVEKKYYIFNNIGNYNLFTSI